MVLGFKPMGNQLLKRNLDTKLDLTTNGTSRVMPIPPLKEVQTRVQCPMGAGELAFRNMILNISYA